MPLSTLDELARYHQQHIKCADVLAAAVITPHPELALLAKGQGGLAFYSLNPVMDRVASLAECSGAYSQVGLQGSAALGLPSY